MARRTKEDAEVTRHKLLDAAEQVFHAQGVAGASLADVAARASLSRGAIYWHFKDKLALFEAMLQRAALPIERVLGAVPVQEEDPLRRVLAILELLFKVIEGDSRTRRVLEIAMLKVEHVGELAVVQQRWASSADRFVHLLEQEFVRAFAQFSKPAPVDAALAARGVQSLMDGLLYAWMLRQSSFSLEAQGMALVCVYLRGLGFDVEKKSNEFFC